MSRLLALLLLAAPFAARATDVVFMHTGRLLDGSDNVVDATDLSMTFSIFSAENPSGHETAVWEDTFKVAVSKGFFAVQLGAGTQRLDSSKLPPGEERWLQVTVGTTRLQPRLRLGTVPMAALAFGLDCQGCVDAKQLKDGAITDAKILELAAGKITGQLADGQISAVSASKISGRLSAEQLPAIPVALLEGQLPVTQLSGTLDVAQLPKLPPSQISGTLALSQIPAIPPTQISGTLSASQLPSIPSSQIEGKLTTSQLPAIPPSQIDGTLALSQLPAIPASQLTGTLSASQLPTIDASLISGTIPLEKLSGNGTITGTVTTGGRITSGAGVKLGNDTATCNASAAGVVRFANGVFEGCNGSAWVPFAVQYGTQANPAVSCLDLKQKSPGVADGTYWIKPAGVTNAFQAFCDMTTDGGGYTYYAVSGGAQTCRYTDNNGCKALGMDLAIPRTKAHWQAMVAKYGASYFAIVPGIWNTTAGNYTSCAMRSPAAYGSGCPDWRATDGGKWWIRDSAFGEPNGDYTPGCWLGITTPGYSIDASTLNAGQGFNDGNCSYCATSYVCSTNDKP